MKHKVKRVHFVGIGGSGMSGIAEVLVTQGYGVSGSDLSESAATRHQPIRMVPGFGQFHLRLRGHRDEDIRLTRHASEARWQDSENGVRDAVEAERPARDRRVAAEKPHPEAVTQHDERRRVRRPSLIG